MATYTTLSSLFTAIANAIRSKTGGTGSIVADNFPAAISSLETANMIPVTIRNSHGSDPFSFYGGGQTFTLTKGTSKTIKMQPGEVLVVSYDDDTMCRTTLSNITLLMGGPYNGYSYLVYTIDKNVTAASITMRPIA